MNPEMKKISWKELMFAVFCFMHSTILRSGFIISGTRNDSWAMAFTGLLFTLPMVAIYAVLLRKFPGKSLIEIDDIIFGPVLGKIVSALYLFFFVSLAALNTRDLGNFVVGYMMLETPLAAVIFIFLIGCVYTIRKGIENLMNLSTFLFIISVGALAVNCVLVLRYIQPEFLKPFFRLEPLKYVQGTVSVAAVPMGEVLAFTMVTPLLGKDKKAAKPLLLSIVSLPAFESMRYVSLEYTLTRMESIYAVILVILYLFKVSILIYAFALGLTQMLSRKSQLYPNPDNANRLYERERLLSLRGYPPFLLISAAFVFFYSLFVFESIMENMDWGATTAPFFSLTFELLLPAVSLLAASLRKAGGAREVKA